MRSVALVIVLLGYFFASQSTSFAAEPTKLLIAHGAISNNVEPLWIAKEQGIYRKYGIDAELVFIIAGRAMQAMLAGQVPVGTVGATHVVNANTGGGDFRMILGMQNTLDYLFIARPNIKSAEDLKGKKATSLSPEFGQVVVSEGYRILLNTSKENVPFQSSGLVVPRSLMKTNPQLVENVAKATVEGVAFVHKASNKEIVFKSLARNLRLSKPEQVEKAYQNLVAELPKKPCPTMDGVASVIKLMAQHGLNAKAAQVKAEDLVDMSYCKRFEDSGFFRSLY